LLSLLLIAFGILRRLDRPGSPRTRGLDSTFREFSKRAKLIMAPRHRSPLSFSVVTNTSHAHGFFLILLPLCLYPFPPPALA